MVIISNQHRRKNMRLFIECSSGSIKQLEVNLSSKQLESMLKTHVTIMKETCDNRYFKYIINIQLDVYRMGGSILIEDGLPYRGTLKLTLYHLLGIKRLCLIHKLFRIIAHNR